jgi:hypothetical protein
MAERNEYMEFSDSEEPMEDDGYVDVVEEELGGSAAT